jgi:hypothetical protein
MQFFQQGSLQAVAEGFPSHLRRHSLRTSAPRCVDAITTAPTSLLPVLPLEPRPWTNRLIDRICANSPMQCFPTEFEKCRALCPTANSGDCGGTYVISAHRQVRQGTGHDVGNHNPGCRTDGSRRGVIHGIRLRGRLNVAPMLCRWQYGDARLKCGS